MIRPHHRTEPHTGTCSLCARTVHWPAVQPHLPVEVRSLCADCYPGAFLARNLDLLEILARHPEAEAAWGQVAPVLFDNVRAGWPEPEGTLRFLDWLHHQDGRQGTVGVLVYRETGVRYDLPRHLSALIGVLTAEGVSS
jgi:hypothetical protein